MLLLSAAAAVGLTRIDKLGFYHRYFRVISEIEQRNSQPVDDATIVHWSAIRLISLHLRRLLLLGFSASHFIPSFSFATEIAAPAAASQAHQSGLGPLPHTGALEDV
ncbi:MAG: hypothetical protein R3B47_11780 [Bacteroidia bacterium]